MAEEERAGEARDFPTYEEFAADLIEELERAQLAAEDVVHEIEPGSGERTFHISVRLGSGEAPSRYGAGLHFHWDALLTYVGVYGPGSECDLYHDEDEACAHQGIRPRPFVEVVAEYSLGAGGYQLSDLGELHSWIETVEGLLSRAVPDQEGRTVRMELAVHDGGIWVEHFFAEQSWYLSLGEQNTLSALCEVVAGTLRATPALADRLPL